jgi:putative endonuclease
MCHVYVLRSEKTGRLYTGSCEDLEDRISRHNAGRSLATKHGVPWKLVYSEIFETRSEAVAREKFFKTGKGRSELQSLISG